MAEKKFGVKQKKAVIEQANGCCEYCQSQARFATQPFSIEHILPVSKGGETTLGNLVLSCQGCNNHKYNKTEAYDAVSGETVSLFHPRGQVWLDHFVWNSDFSLVIGITSVGRSTVEALRLNREGLVNLRRIQYDANEHPPYAD